MKRGKRCFVVSCFAVAPFASPANPEVHACEDHKKRDFVNMRNKRCLAPGCYRNPHYGVSRSVDPNSKAQFCTEHKAPGMENVNGGRCAGPDCSKQPRFALPGNKGKFCSKHREEGMVDVLYTPCATEGCVKHPHFGYTDGGPRYCAQHRAEGMVDVKHRRCAVKGCRKDRLQMTVGPRKRGKYCDIHTAENEMGPTPNEVHQILQAQHEHEVPTSSGSGGKRINPTSSSCERHDGPGGSDYDKRRRISMPAQRHDHGGRTFPSMSHYSSSGEEGSDSAVHGIMVRPAEGRFPFGNESQGPPSFVEADRAPPARVGWRAPPSALRFHFEDGGGTERYSSYYPAPPSQSGRAFFNIGEQGDSYGYSTSSSRFAKDLADHNPYPLFRRRSGERERMLPKPGAGGSVAGSMTSIRSSGGPPRGPLPIPQMEGDDGTVLRPFRLRCWKPSGQTLNEPWYPCPWEFFRGEGRGGSGVVGSAGGGSVDIDGYARDRDVGMMMRMRTSNLEPVVNHEARFGQRYGQGLTTAKQY